MEWSDEKAAELIHLYVYAGKNGTFQLYEDEGTNYNYEKGKYATIDIAYDDATRTVTFGERKGKFKGMLTKRRFHIVLIDKQTPKPLDLDRADSLLAPAGSGKQTGEPSQEEGKLVDYNGKSVSVKL